MQENAQSLSTTHCTPNISSLQCNRTKRFRRCRSLDKSPRLHQLKVFTKKCAFAVHKSTLEWRWYQARKKLHLMLQPKNQSSLGVLKQREKLPPLNTSDHPPSNFAMAIKSLKTDSAIMVVDKAASKLAEWFRAAIREYQLSVLLGYHRIRLFRVWYWLG